MNFETLYHWANPTRRDSIRATGLEAGRDSTGRNRVYLDLLCDVDDAGEEYDIWAVDVSGLQVAEDASEQNLHPGEWFEVKGSIGPERLTLAHEGELDLD